MFVVLQAFLVKTLYGVSGDTIRCITLQQLTGTFGLHKKYMSE